MATEQNSGEEYEAGPDNLAETLADIDEELAELLLEDELSFEDDELLLDALSFDDELSFEEDESELEDDSEPESLLPTVDPERLSVR